MCESIELPGAPSTIGREQRAAHWGDTKRVPREACQNCVVNMSCKCKIKGRAALFTNVVAVNVACEECDFATVTRRTSEPESSF
jgi:hypothetical protein